MRPRLLGTELFVSVHIYGNVTDEATRISERESLYQQVRTQSGRSPTPSVVIMDGQSVKSRSVVALEVFIDRDAPVKKSQNQPTHRRPSGSSC